jgi:hypothetical protein
MAALNRKVLPAALAQEPAERVRLRSHVPPPQHRRLLCFGLGLLAGASLAVLLVISGRFPGLSGASFLANADRAGDIGPLGGRGCRKKVFDNQTGQMTETSCDTTSQDANGLPLPKATTERVNAIGRWFKQ